MASEGKSNTEDTGKSPVPFLDLLADIVATAELAADFSVWLQSQQSDFLQNRLLYVNWDADDLLSMQKKIEDGNLLSVTVRGWDSTTMAT